VIDPEAEAAVKVRFEKNIRPPALDAARHRKQIGRCGIEKHANDVGVVEDIVGGG
jgi:hypothetical protein